MQILKFFCYEFCIHMILSQDHYWKGEGCAVFSISGYLEPNSPWLVLQQLSGKHQKLTKIRKKSQNLIMKREAKSNAAQKSNELAAHLEAKSKMSHELENQQLTVWLERELAIGRELPPNVHPVTISDLLLENMVLMMWDRNMALKDLCAKLERSLYLLQLKQRWDMIRWNMIKHEKSHNNARHSRSWSSPSKRDNEVTLLPLRSLT